MWTFTIKPENPKGSFSSDHRGIFDWSPFAQLFGVKQQFNLKFVVTFHEKYCESFPIRTPTNTFWWALNEASDRNCLLQSSTVQTIGSDNNWCIFSVWSLRLSSDLNLLWHSLHSNGVSPVCFLSCMASLLKITLEITSRVLTLILIPFDRRFVFP